MSFLSPIWFFALAAVSIPVLIHVWNVRPGKTLKVGSISLITEASKTTSRSFKLLDILLLILRCLLLTLLAFILAGPVGAYILPGKKTKGWVLIPKENFKESYQKFKPQVDSLTRSGYEFHYFNKGFAKQDLHQVVALASLKDTNTQANYWTLAKQLNEKARNNPAYIITPNGLSHFKGEKPAINPYITWKTYTQADSVSRWIAAAWMNNTGDIEASIGNSTPSGTSFSTETVRAGDNTGVIVTVKNGLPFISLKNAGQQPVAVDTTTLNIAVYTDKYGVDAGYLKAALQAATGFISKKATVKAYTSSNQIHAKPTWLFWLSESPIDSRLQRGMPNIFKYEPGKAVDVHTSLNPGDMALTKLITASPYADVLWKDGFGKPVLSREQEGRTTLYHFYTHFNPSWGDMVWNDAFPKQILELLIGKTHGVPPAYDKRVLSAKQLLPNNIVNSYTSSSVTADNPKNISPYFWLTLVVVFFVERWLSHTKKSTSNG